MKEASYKEQKENERKQKILRFAVVILAVVGVGLSIFSFISASLVFGIVFALLSLVFIVGIFLVKSKEIGHSETFSNEIEDLQHQINDLEANYNLDFDLDDQNRICEQFNNSIKTQETLDKKANYLSSNLESAQQQYS